jgi:hypothetical protein
MKSRPLSDFEGRSNSLDILTGLPGERIWGAFQDTDGSLVLVMESGAAFVIVSLGGGSPAFWVERAERWQTRLSAIRKRMKELHDGLGNLVKAAPPGITDD